MLNRLCVAVPFLLCVGLCVTDYFDNGIENPGELFLCVVFVFIIEVVLMYFLYNIYSVSLENIRNWIKKEREKQFDEEIGDVR